MADDLIIHSLQIIRDRRVIEVLASPKFQVIQRDNKLDYYMHDGQLTAVLQALGVQVGDELEFSATIGCRDRILGDNSHAALQRRVVRVGGKLPFPSCLAGEQDRTLAGDAGHGHACGQPARRPARADV
jgi:hypothetical protein